MEEARLEGSAGRRQEDLEEAAGQAPSSSSEATDKQAPQTAEEVFSGPLEGTHPSGAPVEVAEGCSALLLVLALEEDFLEEWERLLLEGLGDCLEVGVEAEAHSLEEAASLKLELVASSHNFLRLTFQELLSQTQTTILSLSSPP